MGWLVAKRVCMRSGEHQPLLKHWEGVPGVPTKSRSKALTCKTAKSEQGQERERKEGKRGFKSQGKDQDSGCMAQPASEACAMWSAQTAAHLGIFEEGRQRKGSAECKRKIGLGRRAV